MIEHGVLQGDCMEILKTLDPESVQCIVTSPPYYGLRSYGYDDIGHEETPESRRAYGCVSGRASVAVHKGEYKAGRYCA